MKASKFSDAPIAFVSEQAENGTPIGEVCGKAGIAVSTFYGWRTRFAGLMPSEVKRFCQMEEENRRLREYGDSEMSEHHSQYGLQYRCFGNNW